MLWIESYVVSMGVVTDEARGVIQDWIIEDLVNHLREFGIYRVALEGH